MKKLSLLLITLSATSIFAADEPETSGPVATDQLIQQFSAAWEESHWTESSGSVPDGYLRITDDRGWKVRMRVLQKLVTQGEAAIPDLLKALKSESTPERILAAQTLGYLAPHVPLQPLLQAAGTDADAAVRLYAVDSLGMQGVTSDAVDWQQLLKNETNRDVRKHIRYAMERQGQPLNRKVTKQLIEWNADSIGTAAVGQLAPDFELVSATGETVKLSQFRGSKAVVLVFIYGDT